MDEIIIEDIEVFAHHGYFDFEKVSGQNFYVTVKMMVDTLTKSDELTKTVDYGEVATKVHDYVADTKYDLIESVAHGVAMMLLTSYELIREVEVTIKKPEAPIKVKFGNVAVVVREKKHIAYIGLGSNLGNREDYIFGAVKEFENDFESRVLKVSNLIETEPYGVLDQPKFMNGVLMLETLHTPIELLRLCKQFENKAHRVTTRRWGERTLDLDILLYDDEVVNQNDLHIPHLDMHRREFVLKPLVEIAPGAVHPLLNKTAYTMLKELEANETTSH